MNEKTNGTIVKILFIKLQSEDTLNRKRLFLNGLNRSQKEKKTTKGTNQMYFSIKWAIKSFQKEKKTPKDMIKMVLLFVLR